MMNAKLQRLVGRWTTEASHPALPGVVVHGSADIEWLEGQHFLIQRSQTDHPDFPDSLAIIGVTEQDRVEEGSRQIAAVGDAPMSMHYFDSRGVFRVYQTSVDDSALKFWRDAPGFSQRYTGAFADGDKLIVGLWQLSKDDKTWDDDLRITYRRR